MQESNKKNEENDGQVHPTSFSDERTEKKIHKHLTDIDDEISAEDIRNVNSNINSGNYEITEREPSEKPKEDIHGSVIDKEKDDSKPDDPLPTSYNILES